MTKSQLISCICLGVLIGIACPFDVLGTTTEFGGAEINSHATNIKNLVMGPALRIAGIIGGAWGLAQSYLQQSAMPFLIFGGIGLVSNIMPTFIDKVVGVSTLLLP